MVPASIWGGADDGVRVLVARPRVTEPRRLQYLGDSYTLRLDDRSGWKAIIVRCE